MVQACRVQFEIQRQQILTRLDYTRIGTKGYRVKDWLADLLDWDEAKGNFADAVKPILYATLIETGREAMTEVGKDASSYDPFKPAIQDYFDSRSTLLADEVNDETAKQLRASLAEGVKAGESSYQLRARVEAVMGSASTMRADRIARTEVARAQGYADITAWSQSGVVSGKEWFTARDEKVCIWCNSLDGKVYGLEDNIFAKGESLTVDGKTQHYNYDDVPSAPLHPQCRCTILPVRG